VFPEKAPLDGATTKKKAGYGPAKDPIYEANWDGCETMECGKRLHIVFLNTSPIASVFS
jgi:hypothetical protein